MSGSDNEIRRSPLGRRPGELGPSPLLKRGPELEARYASIPIKNVALAPTEVVYLLDISESMEATLGEVREGCLEAANQLIPKGTQVSLICFSSEHEIYLQHGRDLSEIRRVLNGLRVKGSTKMHTSFDAAKRLLQGRKRPLIHLITDGMPDDPAETIAAAKACIAMGIVVRCSGTTGADQSFLDKLAGGEHQVHSTVVGRGSLRQAICAAKTAALPSPRT